MTEFKFKYIGNHDQTATLGFEFPKGKLVAVTRSVAEKLAGNPTFEGSKATLEALSAPVIEVEADDDANAE